MQNKFFLINNELFKPSEYHRKHLMKNKMKCNKAKLIFASAINLYNSTTILNKVSDMIGF